MKPIIILATAALAMFGSLTESHAATKLLWRTPANRVTTVPNTQGKLSELSQVDVSGYDRIRVIVIARRPTGLAATAGFGEPFHIELHIGEGTDDLGALEHGVFALNPTSTAADVPAHTERASTVFDFPVITTLLVDAVGPTPNGAPTTVDIYVYGETAPAASGP